MTSTLAHCPKCGSQSSGVRRDPNSAKAKHFYASYCPACDFCPRGDAEGFAEQWDTEEEAVNEWNRAVLSDLAAQAREMRAHSQAWPMPEDRVSMSPNPYTLRASIEAVMRDYADLGQNPLVLP